ncbi:uncharacterized protein LOC123552979 [Mercenaria mercenaria]|uniref:uncharacterized protein LOC123552979 n=1 Tax=Mercenaria mercenaria TaxID=6596 RepID=UPI00234F5AB0|nr:uncharacterized protein LOC123552979 [Mercenaria mercenaria]
MHLKLVVIVVFCLILAASAKPAKKPGGKGKKGDKGSKGGLEKPLVKLCDGLDSGDITNTDTDYDGVFTDLEPVCDDLLDYVDSQTEEGNTDGDVSVQDVRLFFSSFIIINKIIISSSPSSSSSSGSAGN